MDVGYGFLPEARGKVYAFTMPENNASKKLLRKLEFKYIGLQNIFDDGDDCVFEYKFTPNTNQSNLQE